MARPHTDLRLTDEERATLTMWVRAGITEHRMGQRAKTILLADEGLRWEAICAQTGLSLTNSLKWQRRFLAERLEGLKDRPRKGRPPTYTPMEKVTVTTLATSKPPEGYSRWSQRRLARAAQMSPSTVNRILRGGALKPHNTDCWCGKSPDPEFAAKQVAIIGLYLDPSENALVLAVDEKSQIQALDRTQPELPPAPDHPRRQTATYTRHGTACLLAALSVHEGQVEGRCVARTAHEEFLGFLKRLYRKYPHRHLHIICDNLSAHKHAEVKQWVAKRRRLTLHFTPTYASWLNQIEIWFHIFTRDVVRGGVWRSRQELVRQIITYINHYNQTRAKPFEWTCTGQPLAEG
jgi:putative transposase